MQFSVSRLAGYSKNSVKLRPMSQDKAKAGDVVVFELPTNTIVDLRTFSILCKGTAGTGDGANNARFPKHVESLIESMQVEINGTLIDTGFLRYNQLHKIYMDYFAGKDKTATLRNLMQNGTVPSTDDDAAIADDSDTAKLLCFNTFLGFLSAKCPVIDTSILGQVRVLMRVASNDVILTKGNGVASIELNDLFATIDVISVNDGMYYDMVQQRLAEAPIELLFDRYYVFENGKTTAGQTTRWAVATQSLDWVVATLIPDAAKVSATAKVWVPSTKTSQYFTRSGSTVDTSLFNFNNVQYPNYVPTNADGSILCETLQNLNVLSDLLGGGDEKLTSYDLWKSHFWCHVHRFNHLNDAGDDNRLISGLNTLGASAQGYWTTTGTAGDLHPLVFCKTSATLAIGAGRLLEIRS